LRQVVLDTETTGLEVSQGHRIIEIGCVELANRRLTGRHFHRYINPQRDIDAGAIEVHGITNTFLADKPRFAAVAKEFEAFIDGAELIIHNGRADHSQRALRPRFPRCGTAATRCPSDRAGAALRGHRHAGHGPAPSSGSTQ
jgi:DNA polymerase-3 subunit epsilon